MTKIQHNKLINLSILIILTVYVYGVTRDIKDALIVSSMGAEALSVLKLYGALPASILMMLIYTKLLKIFKRATIYHLINGSFILFFIIFTFIIYPNRSSLHWELSPEVMHRLNTDLSFLRHAAIALNNWTYSLFYIVADLWNSMMLVLLFWQIANQLVSLSQAQKLYPALILVAQIGTIAAGETMQYFTNIESEMPWPEAMTCMMIIAIAVSFCMSISFRHLTHNVVSIDVANKTEDDSFYTQSLMMSINMVCASRYTILISALVMCYGFTAVTVENIWKSMLSTSFPDPAEYANFIGQIQTYTAFTIIIFTCSSSYLMRFISWRASSLITPIFISIVSSVFFIALLYYEYVEHSLSDSNTVVLTVSLGAIQYICIKACHAFFDPAKEILFIPLTEPTRSVSKALNMVSIRMGKALGSLVQWIMLAFIPGASLITLIPNIFIIFVIIMITWVLVIIAMSQEFQNKLYNK